MSQLVSYFINKDFSLKLFFFVDLHLYFNSQLKFQNSKINYIIHLSINKEFFNLFLPKIYIKFPHFCLFQLNHLFSYLIFHLNSPLIPLIKYLLPIFLFLLIFFLQKTMKLNLKYFPSLLNKKNYSPYSTISFYHSFNQINFSILLN
jgi:hypothetical protein